MNFLSRIRSIVTMGCLAIILVAGMPELGTSSAIAANLPSTHSLFAVGSTARDFDQKAKADVDEVVGAGTSDQLEGYAQQAKGIVQEKAGDLASQAEGLAAQAQGRAKSDIGQVKGAVEDSADAIGDASETVADKVKGLFD